MVYTQREADGWHLVERDLASGTTRSLHRDANAVVTPQYSPDGTRIAFYSWQNGGAEILEIERASGRIRQLTDSPGDNMYPSYSPDGRRIAFHSTRTGRQHVYVMPLEGGNAVVLSPFAEGVEYAAPDWSPVSSEVVFHGRTRSGRMQIMRADAGRPGNRVQQLTAEGENEDPSWAPDGRHIAFSSTGPGGREIGLYVLDLVTGTSRMLVSGRGFRLPDWSGRLPEALAQSRSTQSRQPGETQK
jgi:TolB protein